MNDNSQQSSVAQPCDAATRARKNTVSLVHLFQIVTGCCLFFACMRISPVAAILLTVVATPAIIRTGLISQKYRAAGYLFGWRHRVVAFSGSVIVTLMTLAVAFAVFLLVSIAFGLICVLVTMTSLSARDLLSDIGFIGTLGGTIWGTAGAILSVSWTQHLWHLPGLSDADQQLKPTQVA